MAKRMKEEAEEIKAVEHPELDAAETKLNELHSQLQHPPVSTGENGTVGTIDPATILTIIQTVQTVLAFIKTLRNR